MGKPHIYPLEILLIESDSKNIGLVRNMLDSTKILYKLHLVNDPHESIAFLQKIGNYKKAPVPDAIMHSSPQSAQFEKKIAEFLDTHVLCLNITDDKIEITKSNKHDMNHQLKKHGISHILEAIVSVKKFMGSLIVPTKHERKKK